MWHLLFRKVAKPLKRRGKVPLKHIARQEPYRDRELAAARLSRDLEGNIRALRAVLGGCQDFVTRSFRIGGSWPAAVVTIDGMVDKAFLNEVLLRNLIVEWPGSTLRPTLDALRDRVPAGKIQECRNLQDLVTGVLAGDAVLLVDGENRGLVVSAEGYASRAISEPASEAVVRGPREGFTENLRVNLSLLRRRIHSPNLIVEEIRLGRISHTPVAMVYLRGVASRELVGEVRRRLNRIDIDGVLESAYLEELIEDNPYSPFPQVLATERPDKVAAALLEGRVAVLTNGTPFALIAPTEFVVMLHAAEDYYQRYLLGTALRVMRYLAFAASLLLPSAYIAVTTFHQEMLPTRLLMSIAAAREGVPFPALVEALLMEISFEALREAGIRLPRPVGQAVSIVGALVIGQAAVTAGLVSPLMVIVVAITGIASFMAPIYDLAVTARLLRFPMMLLAGSLGLFGVMAGVLAILIHVAGLRSFGMPYLAPLTPVKPADWKDVAVRAPVWALRARPAQLAPANRYRVARGLKPYPGRTGPAGGGG